YALNGFPLRISIRPRIRRGDPIPLEYGPDVPRIASPRFSATFDVAPALHLESGVIPDARHGTAGRFYAGLRSTMAGISYRPSPLTHYGGWQTYDWPRKLSAMLRDGPQTATLHYGLIVTDGPQANFADSDRTATAVWQLLPPEMPSTSLVTDPAKRPAVQAVFAGG